MCFCEGAALVREKSRPTTRTGTITVRIVLDRIDYWNGPGVGREEYLCYQYNVEQNSVSNYEGAP